MSQIIDSKVLFQIEAVTLFCPTVTEINSPHYVTLLNPIPTITLPFKLVLILKTHSANWQKALCIIMIPAMT